MIAIVHFCRAKIIKKIFAKDVDELRCVRKSKISKSGVHEIRDFESILQFTTVVDTFAGYYLKSYQN